jgi:hypothetical protein
LSANNQTSNHLYFEKCFIPTELLFTSGISAISKKKFVIKEIFVSKGSSYTNNQTSDILLQAMTWIKLISLIHSLLSVVPVITAA